MKRFGSNVRPNGSGTTCSLALLWGALVGGALFALARSDFSWK
jgi:hypothetical protein